MSASTGNEGQEAARISPTPLPPHPSQDALALAAAKDANRLLVSPR